MSTDITNRFDFSIRPHKCRWYLKPIIWGLSIAGVAGHHHSISKEGLEGLKPPYVLLGNHNAFMDMNVSALATFPRFGNYVVAIDGFIKREGLLRGIGCICKRKFTNDLSSLRNIKHVIDYGGIVVIYPEARYSLCGTTAPLPESLGKLCKYLDVPIVTLICHGHHINHPFWNTRHERKVKKIEAEMKLLFSKEQIQQLSVEEINSKLVEAFQYDDFKWQEENKIKVDCKDRAEGLEKILYKCPHCGQEFKIKSSGSEIRCENCGKSWTMDIFGRLHAKDGKTEYPHIPDWYEWERSCVKQEVADGTYSSGILPVQVNSLPNSKGYVELGKGTLVHDMNGFHVNIKDDNNNEMSMEKTVQSMYSCHIEYEYLFKYGDCIDLNTNNDTWYIYPKDCDFSVTKIALATEELFYAFRQKSGNPCKPGLA